VRAFVSVAEKYATLIILPSGSNFVRSIGRSMLWTCEDETATPGSRLLWKDPHNNEIPEGNNLR